MIKIGRYGISFHRAFWFQTQVPTTVRRFWFLWVVREARPTDVDKEKRFPIGTPMEHEEKSYTCPGCGMTSYHPEDVRHQYCGNCHRTRDELERTQGRTAMEKLTPEDDKLLKGGECPKCHSKHFVEGPRGGLAVNITCENGHRFWFSPPFTSEYQGEIRVERHGDRLEAWF